MLTNCHDRRIVNHMKTTNNGRDDAKIHMIRRLHGMSLEMLKEVIIGVYALETKESSIVLGEALTVAEKRMPEAEFVAFVNGIDP